MRIRTNVLAWIGVILSVLGIGVSLISNVSKWFVLIPVGVLVVSLVALLKSVNTNKTYKVRWALAFAWLLATLFAIATVLVAIKFGWLALLPFVCLCSVAIWLVYLIKRTAIWIPIIALVIAIILLGVYLIMGDFMKDWSAAMDTLTVKNLVVENATVENETVNNQTVEEQKVENQKVENSEVKEQKVENQKVENQVVENQQVENQVVEDQTVQNQVIEDKEDDTHKHSYTKKIVAPTCTEKGYTVYTCTCGDTYKDNYKDALGHKYNSKVIAPTASDKGYTLHTCERCGDTYKDNYTECVKPEGHKHNYSTKVIAPTCTEKGYTVYTCTCGDTYKDNYKDALGHKYSTKVQAPTCTDKGYTTYTCACGNTYKGDYKDALGHKYSSKVVAPTTTAQGYTLYTCERCGATYKDNYTDMIKPAINCPKSIRYGETIYATLTGIDAKNILVSNKNFVSVEIIASNKIAITLNEDVDGYITVTDSVSRVNVVIDIVVDEPVTTYSVRSSSVSVTTSSEIKDSKVDNSIVSKPQSIMEITGKEEVKPEIKCSSSIRYGETLFVNLKGIKVADLYVGNPAFVSVEIISENRVSVTLTEDVTGYIVIKDNVSGYSISVEITD